MYNNYMNKTFKQDGDKIIPLLKWELLEEKVEQSIDRELFIILIGSATVIFAFLTKTFVFAALVVFAAIFFIYTGRIAPKKLSFQITNIGLFLDSDFLPTEDIISFNIIDIPGERAKLLLQIKKLIYVNEIIPIYDVDIDGIKRQLRKIGVREDRNLELTIIDSIASLI